MYSSPRQHHKHAVAAEENFSKVANAHPDYSPQQHLTIDEAMRRGMYMAEEADESVQVPVKHHQILPPPNQRYIPQPQPNQLPPPIPPQYYHSHMPYQQHQQQMYWNTVPSYPPAPPHPQHNLQQQQQDTDVDDLDSLEYSKSSYGSGDRYLVPIDKNPITATGAAAAGPMVIPPLPYSFPPQQEQKQQSPSPYLTAGATLRLHHNKSKQHPTEQLPKQQEQEFFIPVSPPSSPIRSRSSSAPSSSLSYRNKYSSYPQQQQQQKHPYHDQPILHQQQQQQQHYYHSNSPENNRRRVKSYDDYITPAATAPNHHRKKNKPQTTRHRSPSPVKSILRSPRNHHYIRSDGSDNENDEQQLPNNNHHDHPATTRFRENFSKLKKDSILLRQNQLHNPASWNNSQQPRSQNTVRFKNKDETFILHENHHQDNNEALLPKMHDQAAAERPEPLSLSSSSSEIDENDEDASMEQQYPTTQPQDDDDEEGEDAEYDNEFDGDDEEEEEEEEDDGETLDYSTETDSHSQQHLPHDYSRDRSSRSHGEEVILQPLVKNTAPSSDYNNLPMIMEHTNYHVGSREHLVHDDNAIREQQVPCIQTAFPQHFFPEEAVEESKDENPPSALFPTSENTAVSTTTTSAESILHAVNSNDIAELEREPYAVQPFSKQQNEEEDAALVEAVRQLEISVADPNSNEALMNFLMSHKSNAIVLSKALDMVCHIASRCACASSKRPPPLSYSIIHVVVEAMWEHCTVPDLQQSACYAIWGLSAASSTLASSSSENWKTVIANAGAIEAILVCAMEMHRNNPSVQMYACGALSSLASGTASAPSSPSSTSQTSSTAGGTPTVASVGAMISIVSVMETHTSYALVQEWAMRAVYSICIGSKSDPKHADENKMDFMQKGGIGLIQRAMELHAECDSLQEWACRLFQCLSSTDTASRVILSTGIVETILNALRNQHRSSQLSIGLYCAACATLVHLAQTENAMDLLPKKNNSRTTWVNVCELVIGNMMSNYLEVPSIMEYSCRLLSFLALPATVEAGAAATGIDKSEEESCLRQAIIDLGGIDAVFGVIQKYPSNESLQEQAFTVLLNLITNCPKGKAAVSDTKHIPVLLRTLQEQFLSTKALQPICAVIASLCVDHDRHAPFISANVLHSLVRVMEAHPHASDLQQIACLSLQNISACTNHTEKMIESSVVNALVQAMEHNLRRPALQEAACSTLYFLSSAHNGHDQNAAIILQAGGARAIIHAMQENPEVPIIQELGCAVLWNLSCCIGNPSSTTPQATNNNLPTSTTDISADGIVPSMLGPQHEDHKSVIAFDGGIDCIMFAVLNNPDKLSILQNAVGALSSLVASRDVARFFLSSDWIDVLVEVMKSNIASSVPLLQYACLAIRNLACSITMDQKPPKTLMTAASSAIHTLVAAMNEHPDAGLLQREACGALFSLSVLSIDNKALVVSCGGSDALVKALESNNCSVDQKETRQALVHLWTW